MALWSALMIVAAAAALHGSPALAATNHVVGGSFGWKIPPNNTFYSEWVVAQDFAYGDTLEFNFTTGQHDVIRVPKSGYDVCSSTNVIGIGNPFKTGPATFTLNAFGNWYFFCGVPGHCDAGQKIALAITHFPSSGADSPSPVTAASGPTPPATAGGGANAAPGTPSGIRTAAGFTVAAAVLSLVF